MNDLAVPIPKNSLSIQKDMDKCINCGNCLKTCIDEVVSSKILQNNPDAEPLCIDCGRCINTCPKDALKEKIDYLKVKNILHNKQDKTIIISIAPAIRVTLAEELFNKQINLESKIPNILRNLGADYAFDITFGADMTVIEEAREFVDRLKNNERIPQFTSCCPSWVKYLEIFYPNLIPNLSTTKSPIAIQSSLIKSYFANEINVNPNNIIHIVIAPCTAKKTEITRKELSITNKDTDYLLTTKEFIQLIKEENIDINMIEDSHFDSIFGKGSGAGVIFGTSGGVLTSVIRTAYYLYTGKNIDLERLEFNALTKSNEVKETNIYFGDRLVRVAVCNGIKNARELIEKILKKEVEYDLIEVMSCEGGCVGGGGQPKTEDIKHRKQLLLDEDKKMKNRLCHENKNIIKIYRDLLERPGSDIAKKILHTSYEDKSYLLEGNTRKKEI